MSVSDWRSSPFKRAQVAAIAALGHPLINLLGHTLRWRVEGLEHLEALNASGKPPILAFWHGRIFGAAYYFRRRGIVALTSENFDGEWVARILEKFGNVTARGSTSHGGGRALLQLVRAMEEGRMAAFALDGPRGPAGVAQPGALWLAARTGHPILPFHLEARRHWSVRSWDRTQIPKPFSTIALVIGEPLEVAHGASDAMLESSRQALEARLAALGARAKEVAG